MYGYCDIADHKGEVFYSVVHYLRKGEDHLIQVTVEKNSRICLEKEVLVSFELSL